jgi:hypothetical protein
MLTDTSVFYHNLEDSVRHAVANGSVGYVISKEETISVKKLRTYFKGFGRRGSGLVLIV